MGCLLADPTDDGGGVVELERLVKEVGWERNEHSSTLISFRLGVIPIVRLRKVQCFTCRNMKVYYCLHEITHVPLSCIMIAEEQSACVEKNNSTSVTFRLTWRVSSPPCA